LDINLKMKFISQPGVCSIDKDTIKLTESAITFNKDRILDLGTGSGYCAIRLAKEGAKVDAVDISEDALRCASINAKLNKVRIRLFYSDLFKNVKDKYGLIISNPPTDAKDTPFKSRIKYFLRKSFLKDYLIYLSPYLFIKERVCLINRIIIEAKNNLNDEGILLLHLYERDVKRLKSRKIDIEKICDVYKTTGIFKISYKY